MKKGIVGVLNNPATSQNSHSAGMVNIVAQSFEADILTEKDDWLDYDILIVYHGPNFRPGQFNVPGGIGQDILARYEKLLQAEADLIIVKTLDGFQPKDFDGKRVKSGRKYIPILDDIKLPDKHKMIIGDSHSVSVWPDSSWGIERNDGKTLYSFLIDNRDLCWCDELILYFGNIDIRFHLARQKNPIKACEELFLKYVEYADKNSATVVCPLPIENESRKIPGTGQYKGQNFYGSWAVRTEFVEIATEIIQTSGLNYYSWPETFKNEKGELSFDVMESRQSVHLRPKFYTPILNIV